MAAEHQRRKRNAVAQQQRADARRTLELVGRNAHGRHAQRAEAHRQLAHDLHGVGVQRNAGPIADRRKLGDRLQHAGLVIAQLHADQLRQAISAGFIPSSGGN